MPPETNDLSPISRTMLMTLAARAAASERVPEAGFHDPWAEEIVDKLPSDLSSYRNDNSFVRSVVFRAKLLDSLTTIFFQKYTNGIVVGLGCGLCTRSRRILKKDRENAINLKWFFIDLPEVIEIRNKYLPALPDENLIASSILETSWLDMIGWPKDQPLLLIMEGVVSYLPLEQITSLFKDLGDKLGKSAANTELIFDYIHPSLVDSEYLSNKAGGTSTPFQSGFCDAEAVKNLHPSINILAEHSFFSQISPWHKMFALEFEAASLGQKPYNVIHIGFGANG